MTYVIFEAGHTHGGFENALLLVDYAAKAGAQAIKFQAVDPGRLISDKSIMDRYMVLNSDGTMSEKIEPLLVTHTRQQLKLRQYETLVNLAHGHKLDFIATVDFLDTAQEMKNIGVDWFKICSGDITHLRLIEEVASLEVPMMLDTGNCTFDEISEAVETISNSTPLPLPIVIHHCGSGFPAKTSEIDLNCIGVLKNMFDNSGIEIGFSDHSQGWDMCVAAMVLGATVLEKTVTLDKYTKSPEHMVSLEPGEQVAFVKAVRDVEEALGPSNITHQLRKEKVLDFTKRRSIFLKNDLGKGSIVGFGDLDFRRPGNGIPANVFKEVMGRKLVRDMTAGLKLAWSDFD